MSIQRQSFEGWWTKRGEALYPASAKEGLWVVFSDAWYRADKEAQRVTAEQADRIDEIAATSVEGDEPGVPQT